MHSINILLVEDNQVNQRVASAILKKRDINVTVANNGQEALHLIQAKTFHMILMDLQMPEMDGYESTHRIRAFEDPYFKTIPIIAFSASSMINTKEKAMAFGMTDFINKPLRPEELQAKINAYVSPANIPGSENPPLVLDFEFNTDNDPVFKYDLLSLLIDNVRELQDALANSIAGNEPEPFLKATHKLSTSIKIVNNKDLTDLIENLKEHYRTCIAAPVKEKVIVFNNLCDYVVKSLQYEVSKVEGCMSAFH